jgi:hypothetical protein
MRPNPFESFLAIQTRKTRIISRIFSFRFFRDLSLPGAAPVTLYASPITLLHPASNQSKDHEIPGAPVALCYGILRFRSVNNAQLRISENALPFTQYDEIPPALFLRRRAQINPLYQWTWSDLTLSPLPPAHQSNFPFLHSFKKIEGCESLFKVAKGYKNACQI